MGLTARPRDRWIPWAVAVVAATSVYAVAVAMTGGFKFSLGTLRFSSHSWARPAAIALIGAVALTMRARGAIAGYVGRIAAAVESTTFCRTAVVAAGIWTLAVGIAFGTFASGGADSYGYVGQARLLAHGRLTDTIPRQRRLYLAECRLHVHPARIYERDEARGDRANISAGISATTGTFLGAV